MDRNSDDQNDEFKLGNSIYMGRRSNMGASQGKCQAIGGDLVSINSQKENDFLYDNFVAKQGDYSANKGNHVWIGATDANNEGKWRWVNGDKWTFSQWASNQPDNALSGENYGSFLYRGNGTWNDARNDYYLEQIDGSHIRGIAEMPLGSRYTITPVPTNMQA